MFVVAVAVSRVWPPEELKGIFSTGVTTTCPVRWMDGVIKDPNLAPVGREWSEHPSA
jgi:hypothetical protein